MKSTASMRTAIAAMSLITELDDLLVGPLSEYICFSYLMLLLSFSLGESSYSLTIVLS